MGLHVGNECIKKIFRTDSNKDYDIEVPREKIKEEILIII